MDNLFLDVDLVTKTLAEYDWPSSYTVENGIVGVEVKFENTIIYIEEDRVPFMQIVCGLSPRVGGIYANLSDVVASLLPEHRGTNREGFIPDRDDLINAHPSREVVETLLKMMIDIIRKHLMKVIEGDHSWIQRHEEFLRNNAEICAKLGSNAHTHPIYDKFLKGDESWREDINSLKS